MFGPNAIYVRGFLKVVLGRGTVAFLFAATALHDEAGDDDEEDQDGRDGQRNEHDVADFQSTSYTAR